MATIAYLRVSTGTQDLDQQRLAIFDYAQKQRLTVDEFVETRRSSQHAAQRRELMEKVEAFSGATGLSSASCRASAEASARSCTSLIA